MPNLFNRSCSVLIGPKGDENGVLIEDLRITFQVEKSLEEYPNNTKIEIYNLSKATRSLIEEKRGLAILRAGYRPEGNTGASSEVKLPVVSIGDIAQITNRRIGPDLIMEIETGDGEAAYKNAKLDASFAPGTVASQVIDALLKKLSLTKGTLKGVKLNEQFLQGLTLSGPVREHLTTLAKRWNVEWSIQDGQLIMLPYNETTDEEVVVLSPASGLIGTPSKVKVVNESLLSKKDGKEAFSGVRCLSLLNPGLKPGRRVKVESEDINGIFKIQRVKINGDTHSNSYYAEIEAT